MNILLSCNDEVCLNKVFGVEVICWVVIVFVKRDRVIMVFIIVIIGCGYLGCVLDWSDCEYNVKIGKIFEENL